jgi:hypothetical protein
MSDNSKFELTDSAVDLQPKHLTWLKEFANKLADFACKPSGQGGPYRNEDDRQGFYICYKYFGAHSDRYLMISRSHSDLRPTKQQIVSELRSNEIEAPAELYGRYHEHLTTPGQYATVRYGSHWYMLSESGIPKPFHNLFPETRRRNARSYANASRF